jgi:hypothetical protein
MPVILGAAHMQNKSGVNMLLLKNHAQYIFLKWFLFIKIL